MSDSAIPELIILFFMAFVAERVVLLFSPVVDPLIQWLQKIAPIADGWWKRIFVMLVQGVIVATTGVNVFREYIPDPFTGQVITIILGSGGANFLHDIWPEKKPITSMAE